MNEKDNANSNGKPDSSSTDYTRVWLAVIIGLVVTLIVYLFVPPHSYNPKGLLLPAKTTQQASSVNQVVVYANFPQQYQRLGRITVVRHYPAKNPKQAERAIINYARQLAAKAGANGLVIQFFAHSISGMGPAGLAVYSFTGIPIYTNSSQFNINSQISNEAGY